VLTFTRRFLRWRKARPALVQGDIRFLDADEPVLLLERTCHRQRLLCAFNLGGAAAAAEVPKGAGFRPLSGHGLSGDMEGSRLVLAPFGGVIAAAG
jgi:alpha-glucosidase